MRRLGAILIPAATLVLATSPALVRELPAPTDPAVHAAPLSGGGNDNGEDNGNAGEDNDNASGAPDRIVITNPPGTGAATTCSTPGQQRSFASADRRITVVVPVDMPLSLRFAVRWAASTSPPPLPGRLVGGLVFELLAEDCAGGPLVELPTPITLVLRYGDADAAGLSEQGLTIGAREVVGGPWRRVDLQLADPTVNSVTAIISTMGYYALHQG